MVRGDKICSPLLGKWLLLYSRAGRACVCFLAKARVELTHHISQACARTHCSSWYPAPPRLEHPPTPCVWAAGMDVFRHNGLIWVDGHSVKKVLSSRQPRPLSRIKKNEKLWEGKNDHCLVSKNVISGQAGLLEESAIDWDVRAAMCQLHSCSWLHI